MHSAPDLQLNDIIFYNTPTGDVKIEVIFNDETFWLTQKKMAELFGVESHTITYHLKEIYKTGELVETATARKIRVVQKEGSLDISRDLDFYNLDAIIFRRLPGKQASMPPNSASGSPKPFGSSLSKALHKRHVKLKKSYKPQRFKLL
jgi:hypothetical protein